MASAAQENSPDVLHGITERDLIRRALWNLRPKKPGAHPRWVAVTETFGLGSNYAKELCALYEIDPDELLEGPVCENCAERPEDVD